MRLPNREKAIISELKIRGYLLSVSHPYGRHKAAFFERFGFKADGWEIMASALRAHAEQYELVSMEDTEFGSRYTVEGPLKAPDGRAPTVRVVWFIERGDDRPRLITAYPREGDLR